MYKTKIHPNDSIEKYKARLVAKGYHQIDGVDFNESFAPVAKTVSIRILIALASYKGWKLDHIDIINAFLHGKLEEDVYMMLPPGYKNTKTDQVCKLNRSIYGLKQSGRQWNIKISNALIKEKYKQSANDHCLFIKTNGNKITTLLV